jgi:hypothetical protein
MGKGESPIEDKPAADKPAPAKPATVPTVRKLAEARPARIAKSSSPPLTSRTATLDDPLTTSLLAEIARRPSTVEMSPEQLAAARTTVEMSPEQLAAARAMVPDAPEATDEHDPDDPA